jgi:hypothetical protein
MGLFRRDELTRSAIGTLTRIRSQLASDTARARFDYFFRPGGRWQVDLHDVALARARRPFPTLGWETVRPALLTAGLADSSLAGVETVPLAVYRLYTLSQTDTAAFHEIVLKLRQADPGGASQVQALVNSYDEASQWYVTALRFLLEERWVPGESGPRSPVALVSERWGRPVRLPEIRARAFGYPEGAVRIGTDSALVRALVLPENAAARAWLERNGAGELLAALHRLALPAAGETRLQVGADLYRLSSVQQYARESFSGFLEPRDLILLDPSYQPLLALGTLIHEWQHILAEGVRQSRPADGAFRVNAEEVTYLPLDPFLAEGFAEWMTEIILEPAAAEFPLVGFGEAEKRISLPQNDPHHLGYLLARTLARALGDVLATRDLLVRAGSSPAAVVRDPRVRRAWASHRGSDRTMGRRSEPAVLPMAVFTIEDGQPDLVQSRIIAPYIPRR